MANEFIKRQALLGLGWSAFAAGAVGIVVPLLPTTVFWLIALWCFGRTSSRMQVWLRNHPRLGQTLADFVDHGAICRRGKYFAIGGLTVSLTLSLWLAMPPLWLTLALVVGALILSQFLWSRPEQPPSPTTQTSG